MINNNDKKIREGAIFKLCALRFLRDSESSRKSLIVSALHARTNKLTPKSKESASRERGTDAEEGFRLP